MGQVDQVPGRDGIVMPEIDQEVVVIARMSHILATTFFGDARRFDKGRWKRLECESVAMFFCRGEDYLK